MSYDHSDDADTTLICLSCIGDGFLREEVRAKGERGDCSYCGAADNVISLDNLADRIHSVLDAQFYVTASEPEGIDVVFAKEGHWERSGEPVIDVIVDISGLDERIAEDIRAYLHDIHGDFDSEQYPYADDAQYGENRPDDIDFRDTWESFCQQLRWRSRFFSQYAEIDLGNIFGDLTSLMTFHTFSMGSGPDDDFDPTIAIFESVPAPVTPKPIELFGVMVSPPDPITHDRDPDAAWLPQRERTLRLDIDSVEVLRVSGTRYECEKAAVMRYRTNRKEEPADPISSDNNAAEEPF